MPTCQAVVEQGEEPKQVKKVYCTPRLIAHGDVREITKAAGGAPTDGLAGSIVGPGGPPPGP